MRLTILLCLSALAAAAPEAVHAKRPDPEEHRKALRERYALDEEIGEPIRVNGEVQFLFDEKAPRGQVQFVATSRHRWREDQLLPGWRSSIGIDDRTPWRWQHPDNEKQVAQFVEVIRLALEPSLLLPRLIRPEATIRKVDGRSIIELRPEGREHPRLRIDEESGRILSYRFRGTLLEFEGEWEAGGRTWPRRVDIQSKGRPSLRVLVTEPVRGSAQVPERLFVQPEGAKSRPLTLQPGLEPPRILEAPSPRYPERLKRQGVAGTVIVRAVIDTEGRVKSAELVEGPNNEMNKSALKAVRGRRYEPGTLEGKPVEVISFIRIDFKLR